MTPGRSLPVDDIGDGLWYHFSHGLDVNTVIGSSLRNFHNASWYGSGYALPGEIL